ncbi:MAG: hypothetical protein M1839_002365 [Geoglossum umbratile]|nr:MAG: hypothetical protein M1839_002365 [Geoglossum umbratile]
MQRKSAKTSSQTEEADKRKISQAVQNIIGAYFQLGEWDFSDQDCYTRDLRLPDRPLGASCVSIADATLRSYIAPTKEVNGTGGETGVTKRKPKQKHKKRQKTRSPFEHNSHSEGLGIANTCGDLDQDRTSDLELIQRIDREIRKGLAAVRLDGVEESVLPLDDGRYPYIYYAIKLQETAEKLRRESRTKSTQSWYASFLSGSACLVSRLLPSRPVEQPDDTIQFNNMPSATLSRWCAVAQFTNALVSDLYPTWKENAYIAIYALAKQDYHLTSISSFSRERLHRIAIGVSGSIQDSIPKLDIDQPLFDPALFLSQLMQVDYSTMCNTLQLPSVGQLSACRVQSGGYWVALTAALQFKPKLLPESDSSHTSEHDGVHCGDSQLGMPLEGSCPPTRRNGNEVPGNSMHHYTSPQSGETLLGPNHIPEIQDFLDSSSHLPEYLPEVVNSLSDFLSSDLGYNGTDVFDAHTVADFFTVHDSSNSSQDMEPGHGAGRLSVDLPIDHQSSSTTMSAEQQIHITPYMQSESTV